MKAAEKTERMVVLVVDDENENAELIGRALASRRDIQTVMAFSAGEALAVLKDIPVDVLVVDQRMPNMTGAQLLNRARQLGYDATGIMVTAYPEDDAVAKAHRSGLAQCIIAKPWESGDLVLAVDFAIGIRRRRKGEG